MSESEVDEVGQRGWQGLKPWENSKPKRGHQIRIWEIYKLFKYSSLAVSYDEYSVFQFNPLRNPSSNHILAVRVVDPPLLLISLPCSRRFAINSLSCIGKIVEFGELQNSPKLTCGKVDFSTYNKLGQNILADL